MRERSGSIPVSGRPLKISARSLIWKYFTPGRLLAGESYLGELQIAFAQVGAAEWEIYGGIGPGVWPTYVLRTFQIVNKATIQDPSLELKK